MDASESPALGDLLRSLVEKQPDLRIRILVWSVAVVHAPSAAMPLLFGADWQDHPRIQVKLDTRHPIYAAHHQKIVCIDDGLAFVGGIDLTVRRWDRPEHLPEDPGRSSPDGLPYGPVHDIQILVEGDAAQVVCALGHDRWRKATGEILECRSGKGTTWPASLHPDFVDVPVAIARTCPAWGRDPAVHEVAALTVDALRAARHIIYIEAQYAAAAYVGDVLAEQLGREAGPEIIILMTHLSRGLLERSIMGRNRDRLIRRLKRADRFKRLRVWYPKIATDDGEMQILVHSKLIIIDDVFIRVGSSNLNNRSVGLDTECDLAIEATNPSTSRTIERVRNQLLAEHLATSTKDVAEAIAETGSIIRAVEALNVKTRRLCPFEAMSGEGPIRPVLGTCLFDPKHPFEPLWLLGRKT